MAAVELTADAVAAFFDRGWSAQQVADEFGCTARTVRNIAHRGGVLVPRDRRLSERARRLADVDWLRTAIVEQHRSPSDVADELGGRARDIATSLEHAGIQLPTMLRVKYTRLYEPGWLQSRFDACGTLRSVADEVGCDRSTVGQAARRMRVRRRAPAGKFPELGNRRWLTSRYIIAGRSMVSIAREVGADVATVARALDRASIPRRPTRRRRPSPSRLRRDWERTGSVAAVARAHGVGWGLAEVWLAEVGIFISRRPLIPRRELRRSVGAGDTLAQLCRLYGMDRRKMRIELLRHGLEPARSTSPSGQRGRFESG